MDISDFKVSDEGTGTTYESWTDGYAIGFKVERGGKIEYIYLNPSRDDDADQPNVFVYQGEHGTPALDTPVHHYLVREPA